MRTAARAHGTSSSPTRGRPSSPAPASSGPAATLIALQALYDLICAQAHQRHLDGDTDPLGARKVKTLAGLGTADAPAADKIKVYVRVERR